MMPTASPTRFLDPQILSALSGLDLVAKTVVDGFVAGLHRSPDFGFSQEFAEYRAYSPGDDLRHVDWNVFARTERAYLKRYRGETNSVLTVLLDASASMGFGSGASVTKFDYARYLAASVLYMANLQRDAAGLIVFDDEVANYIRPSARQGQLARLLHAVDQAALGKRTDFAKPFFHCQAFLRRRGIIAAISDFFEQPDAIIKTVEPLRFGGNEVILFHVLDPAEISPSLPDSTVLVDMETGDALETSPEYAKSEYNVRIHSHIQALKEKAASAGMDYVLLRTDEPLELGLRQYFTVRAGRM
jgi:uncharacterized protein (DUF58 family)